MKTSTTISEINHEDLVGFLSGCMRLASRIHDLRERGLNINACKIKTETGKYVTEYVLAK